MSRPPAPRCGGQFLAFHIRLRYDKIVQPCGGGGEVRMSMPEKAVTWVVYRMSVHGKGSGANAVCEQGEWDAMEAERPGYHTLVRAGIPTEGEAERLARGTAGATFTPRARRL